MGPLSDRFGRRPVLIGGLILFLVATAFCRFAPSIEALIIARGFQAVGGCAGMVLSRAMVRDISSREGAASLLGYVTMGMAVAQMLGPVLGGFLDGFYGWRASFDLLFLMGAVVLAIALLSLKETNRTQQKNLAPKVLLDNHLALLGEVRFLAFALTGAFASGVFFAFLSGGPIIAQRVMGLSPVEYGLYFMLVAGSYAIGNYLSGRFSVQVGPRSMILYGNLFAVAGLALILPFLAAGWMHPMVLFGPMLLVSIANGLCLPNSFSGALSVRPDLAGTASGVAGSIQLLVGGLATVASGALIHLGIWPLVLLMLLLALLSLAAGMLANAMEARATG